MGEFTETHYERGVEVASTFGDHPNLLFENATTDN